MPTVKGEAAMAKEFWAATALKAVTCENYLALARAVTKAKRVK